MMITDKNKNPFRVPDNYFEEVNRKILATSADTPGIKQLSFFQKFRPVLAAAAALAVLLTIGYLTVKHTDKKAEMTGISELLTVDPELLKDEIDMTTLENDADIQSTLDEGSGLSNDVIIDYLVSDDIDISVIYEKL
jgi:hypothetical protein